MEGKDESGDSPYEWEYLVIGGGSGGIASAKAAGELLGPGKVCLLDFVDPSPQGTKWGLGGTCVNVGCIPKKLFHHAAILSDSLDYAGHFGWKSEKPAHDWSALVESVSDYIRGINFGYRKTNLPEYNVTYKNARGRFLDAHTVELTDRRGNVTTTTARYILVAVGGRPVYPDIPGAREFGITSDDVFSLDNAPGKTLLVGASYVSLECAGFLAGLGYDVTVMVRSILLRGFDQQVAELIGSHMGQHGVKFIRPATPSSVEKLDSGRLRVKWTPGAGADASEDTATEDEFDTVLFAIGRRAETHKLNLEAAGVKTKPNGKFEVTNEATNVDNIFAVGDVIDGVLELTPSAIQAGKLLAERLFGNSTATMDYELIPTTVFTPLEYGCVGLSEEAAIARHGEDDVEVYHTYYTPLEWNVAQKPINTCYAKLVCQKSAGERVLGFHVLGDHAGEITQGFGLAVRLGAKKADFDALVGIHPTSAEEFTTLDVTKASGVEPVKSAC